MKKKINRFSPVREKSEKIIADYETILYFDVGSRF